MDMGNVSTRDTQLHRWKARQGDRPPGEGWAILARTARYDVRELARLLQVTARQMQRYCRQELGCTPRRFLLHQRMEDAQLLLLEAETIKWVAAHLGFKQVSHFCRVFKRHHGVTPSEYIFKTRHADQPEAVQPAAKMQ